MTKRRDDSEIEDRFSRLRAETEGSERVPDFQAMMDRARRDAEHMPALTVVEGEARRPAAASPPGRRRFLWIGGGASAALAAAVTGLLLTTGGATPDEEFDRLITSFTTEAAAAWRSPTSRLLDVPGIELVRTVPSVGRGLPGAEAGERSGAPGSAGREGRS